MSDDDVGTRNYNLLLDKGTDPNELPSTSCNHKESTVSFQKKTKNLASENQSSMLKGQEESGNRSWEELTTQNGLMSPM